MELADIGDIGGLWDQEEDDSGDDVEPAATQVGIVDLPRVTVRTLPVAIPTPNAPFRLGVRKNKVIVSLFHCFYSYFSSFLENVMVNIFEHNKRLQEFNLWVIPETNSTSYFA